MGVSGTVGVIQRLGADFTHSTQIELKNTTVIIDTTSALFWFIKVNLLAATRMDKYGTSMHKLGKCYWNLLNRIKERNNIIHLVFEGARQGEQNGRLISKASHMENSAAGAFRRLTRGQLNQMDNLPELSINCLKEIINELKLGPDQVHQAEGEVYPTLVYLSNKFNAPVLTNHSDFIFRDVPAGFVWLEQLRLPSDSTSPINCRLFTHQRMLTKFNLGPEHSGALSCLSVLLRDDFAESYYVPINKCLNLTGNLRIGPNVRFARVKTRRLLHILENWPRNLTDQESVRRSLQQQVQAGPYLMRDFEALRESYCDFKPFVNSDLAIAFQTRWRDLTSARPPGEALTRRESSAEFLANVLQKNFNRTGIEDTTTFRSTFSLQDRAKQYLMDRLRVHYSNGLEIFDRQGESMVTRHLRPVSDQSEPALDQSILFALFHFKPTTLESVSAKLRDLNQIDAIIANELALLLLLASFSLRLVPRVNYNNDRDEPAGNSENSGRLDDRRYSDPETKKKFLTAILNSYVYLQSRTSHGDQSPPNVPADIRLARGKVDEIAASPPAPAFFYSDKNYLLCKHLIEALNSTLHAYKELNSLYNYPGPNVLVNKYYDGVLIYKIMARLSNNLQEFMLRLDEGLLNEL